MKKFLLLMLISFIAYTAVQAQKNLIVNSDFEKWESGSILPDAWASTSTLKSLFKKSSDAHSGKNALRLTFTPKKEGDNRRFYSSELELEEGTYISTIYLKGLGDIRFTCLTKIDAKPGSNTNAGSRSGAPKIGAVDLKEWTQYKQTYKVAESGTYMLHIGINSGSEEIPFLIDDISLVKE